MQLAPASFAVNYDFSSSSASGNIVPSIISGNPLFSGLLSNIGGYYGVSGSGSFSNETIAIQNASGLNSNSFSILLAYEKPTTGNGIIFSSLTSGNGVISGFAIGVNDSNKLYFETADNSGPFVVTSSNIYSSKNAVAIVKSNNSLNFHYYNFNTQLVESENFTISAAALYNSNQVYLGGTGQNTPSYITQNNFSGYISEFAYFNLAFTQNTIQKLFSGFYCNRNPSLTGVLGYSSGIGFITGGAAIYTGIGTGITGYQTFLAGTYVDMCGNQHAIYSYNNLTGIISGYKFFPITGVFISTGTGLIDQGYAIDTGFAASFGMDGLIYDRHKNIQDFNELYVCPSILVKNINQIAQYNLDGTYKLNTISANGQFNLYANGLAQIPSGFITSGNIYVQQLILLGDYYTSGQSIVSTGFYQPQDVIIYDYIAGVNEVFYYTGGSQNFNSFFINNRSVYWNGQKLTSGIDYVFPGGTNLTVMGLSGSGVIFNCHFQTGQLYYSGQFNNLQINRFGRDSSQLWLNGQRQELGEDYFEISKVDLLNGSGLYNSPPNIIYNNTKTFIQKF